MLIDCISDLHGYYPVLPGGDLLIIAGDLTARNTIEGYQQFKRWLNELPYRCKIVIAGNHDGLIESGIVTLGNDPSEKNIHYLCDSGLEFEGFKIWGSPYTPTFLTWYFMCDRGAAIKKHWDLIPSDTDILVTHGPPSEILDETIEGMVVGCADLRETVRDRVKPRVHCFGHIHECGGKMLEKDGIQYINCSYVDERYRPVHQPRRLALIT